MMTKSELRSKLRALKKVAEREELERQSDVICERVMRHPCWKEAHTVLLYHALPDEVNTHRLIEEAWQEGKVVLLPVVVADELELRCYDGHFQEGAFHIQEPTEASPLFHRYEDIGLAVVPGMGFDAQGHRLGRGKGYYDKLLCRFMGIYKIGVCFDFQWLDCVPCEVHDIMMDEVVTAMVG